MTSIADTQKLPGYSQQALLMLIANTLALTVCFMVSMMFGGIPIKKALGLKATRFDILRATRVLTGSLIRMPLGIWTDRYGVRKNPQVGARS